MIQIVSRRTLQIVAMCIQTSDRWKRVSVQDIIFYCVYFSLFIHYVQRSLLAFTLNDGIFPTTQTHSSVAAATDECV